MNQSEFSLHTSTIDDIPIVALSGYCGEPASLEMDEYVTGLLEGGRRNFILDFSRCTACSSLGLSNLLDLVERISEDFGGHLTFCGVGEFQMQILTIMGLFHYADTVATVEEAVSAMKARNS